MQNSKKVSEKPVFVSFVEECIFNPKYEKYVGGRVEVYRDGPYADEEIPFFTEKRDEFYKFRELWDFKKISEQSLNKLRQTVVTQFNDHSELT